MVLCMMCWRLNLVSSDCGALNFLGYSFILRWLYGWQRNLCTSDKLESYARLSLWRSCCLSTNSGATPFEVAHTQKN